MKSFWKPSKSRCIFFEILIWWNSLSFLLGHGESKLSGVAAIRIFLSFSQNSWFISVDNKLSLLHFLSNASGWELGGSSSRRWSSNTLWSLLKISANATISSEIASASEVEEPIRTSTEESIFCQFWYAIVAKVAAGIEGQKNPFLSEGIWILFTFPFWIYLNSNTELLWQLRRIRLVSSNSLCLEIWSSDQYEVRQWNFAWSGPLWSIRLYLILGIHGLNQFLKFTFGFMVEVLSSNLSSNRSGRIQFWAANHQINRLHQSMLQLHPLG